MRIAAVVCMSNIGRCAGLVVPAVNESGGSDSSAVAAATAAAAAVALVDVCVVASAKPGRRHILAKLGATCIGWLRILPSPSFCWGSFGARKWRTARLAFCACFGLEACFASFGGLDWRGLFVKSDATVAVVASGIISVAISRRRSQYGTIHGLAAPSCGLHRGCGLAPCRLSAWRAFGGVVWRSVALRTGEHSGFA
jgi:hypothetical protein